MVTTISPQLRQQHEAAEAGDLLHRNTSRDTFPSFRRLVLTLMVYIICGVVYGVYVNLSQCFMEPGHKKCVCCVYSEQCGSNAPSSPVQWWGQGVGESAWSLSRPQPSPAPAQLQPSSAQPIFRAATEQREHLPMAVSIVCLCGRMSPIHLFDFPMILTSILPFNQDWVNIQIIATPIVGNAPGLDPHGRGKIHVQHNPFFERSTEWEKRRMIQILNIWMYHNDFLSFKSRLSVMSDVTVPFNPISELSSLTSTSVNKPSQSLTIKNLDYAKHST